LTDKLSSWETERTKLSISLTNKSRKQKEKQLNYLLCKRNVD